MSGKSISVQYILLCSFLLIINLGSCWALSVMYSGVAGSVLPEDVADYLEDRIQVSYLDMSTLDALVTPPTNKVRALLIVANFSRLTVI